MSESCLQKLLNGDFNDMNQQFFPDGSILVTLTKRGDPHVYRMRVRNLYQANQEVISEEVTDAEKHQ